MKQVKRRTWFCLIFTILLTAGLGIFLMRYTTDGADWAAFRANKHIYNKSGQLMSGTILDRNGKILYDAAENTYSTDKTIRKSTLHAIGDPNGNIATGAKKAFSDHLGGFNPILGTTIGGHNLYLTIDQQLNAAAYKALDGKKGTVGVYNYKTGELLCMVSRPSFDPANPPTISDDDSQYEGVYINRFLSATYTPGSIFKLVTTAAALEQIDDLETRTFTCNGSIQIGNTSITCPHAHGTMDISSALSNSCNGVYAQLAVELGGETMLQYTKKAGLLDSISIDGIATAKGSYTVAEPGSADLGWSGAGQYQDLVNPSAMMTYMGTIANSGTQVLPRLIYKETTSVGLPVGFHSAQTNSGAMKTKTCDRLKEMMRNNVVDHYGQSQFGDLAVCAKSGTAEVGTNQRPHSCFVGFVDDDAHPLAFVVVAENSGSGASVAGSIAAKVLNTAKELGY